LLKMNSIASPSCPRKASVMPRPSHATRG
jgi:hypothetical protein